METHDPCTRLSLLIVCSYPTYEEWKQADFSAHVNFNSRSYPTYEEWKPKTLYKPSNISYSSYPTYEEWKLQRSSIL